LTQTENKTKLSKDPAITTLIIAASYIASLLMISAPNDYLACLNPAIAVGASFAQLYNGNPHAISTIWIYGLIPFGGGLAAVFFFEIIYKNVAQTIKESEDDVDDGILDKETNHD
jgi:glycerol uptake facilitator-like aquaporin